MPYFALSRPASDGREFFAGLTDDNYVATSMLIFRALPFAAREDAEACAAHLSENGIVGFTASEISDGGASDDLRAKK